MKMNFEGFVKSINDYVKVNPEIVKPCTKRGIETVVYPLFNEDNYGAYAYVVLPLVRTAEALDGHLYPHDKYHIVARIIGGKVLFDVKGDKGNLTKRAESYAWGRDKVQRLIDKGATKTLDIDTPEGKNNIDELIEKVSDSYERELLWKMFYKGPRGDLLLAMESAENRFCIYVDEKFISDFPRIVDSWQRHSLDEKGCANATELELGDRVIVTYTESGSITVYRCEGDIYEMTYSDGHLA